MKVESYASQELARDAMIKNATDFLKNYIKDASLLETLTNAIRTKDNVGLGILDNPELSSYGTNGIDTVGVVWTYEDGSASELQKPGVDASSEFGPFSALSKVNEASEEGWGNWRLGASSKTVGLPKVDSGDKEWHGFTTSVAAQESRAPDGPGVGLVWYSVAATADQEKFHGEWLKIVIVPTPLGRVSNLRPQPEKTGKTGETSQLENIITETEEALKQKETTNPEAELQRLRNIFSTMKIYTETESQILIAPDADGVDPYNSLNTMLEKLNGEEINGVEGGLLWKAYGDAVIAQKSLSNDKLSSTSASPPQAE
ncbi:hypothetical protein [Pelotomaculum sp. PtaB.Bin117]|uniref:hypothetical protein n=1 Tax=Pelotomaculum sp. PtaB.Bin117 TaxID=1811694 RepID=UPI0009CC8F0F|nr:hypothetical protein [Pelotomaculum sp. PtaB.Bin117]OPX84581.1 MAG: hypothetical protein A4E54_02848 [Pelotomaculum sp. PtaB.Bin117]OPY59116.1 MAG: hypothetical protein A4E56_03301 [Pelotomaculum sp. PtaU1.Bin065]